MHPPSFAELRRLPSPAAHNASSWGVLRGGRAPWSWQDARVHNHCTRSARSPPPLNSVTLLSVFWKPLNQYFKWSEYSHREICCKHNYKAGLSAWGNVCIASISRQAQPSQLYWRWLRGDWKPLPNYLHELASQKLLWATVCYSIPKLRLCS